jgi:hypothetical protein
VIAHELAASAPSDATIAEPIEHLRSAEPTVSSASAPARLSAISRTSNGGSAAGHTGGTVWLTGLPAAGKTTLAAAVDRELTARG